MFVPSLRGEGGREHTALAERRGNSGYKKRENGHEATCRRAAEVDWEGVPFPRLSSV